MPPIELEDFFLVKSSFHELDYDDFIDQSHDSLASIEEIDPVIKACTTLSRNKLEGDTEHRAKIDKRQEVHGSTDVLHLLLLNALDRIWVVFEVECLVLSMDEGLPNPDGEDNIVPPF